MKNHEYVGGIVYFQDKKLRDKLIYELVIFDSEIFYNTVFPPSKERLNLNY